MNNFFFTIIQNCPCLESLFDTELKFHKMSALKKRGKTKHWSWEVLEIYTCENPVLATHCSPIIKCYAGQ